MVSIKPVLHLTALSRLAEVGEAKKSEAIASKMTASEKSMIVGLDGPMKAQFKLFATPVMRDKLNYDAASVLRRLQCPVLAINGEFDVYSPPKENVPAIDAALKLARSKTAL